MTMFAQSNRTALLLRREAQWGETPVLNGGAAWQTMRFTSESLDLDKKTARSETIRADRMTDALLYLGRSVSGDISSEFTFGDFDDLMCGALGKNAWTIGGSEGAPVSVILTWNAGNKTGTLALQGGGNWSDHGVIPNTLFSVKGFVNAVNNGDLYITAISGADMTVLAEPGVTLVGETLATMSFHFEYLLNSTDQPSYVAEKQFQDSDVYAYYNGLYVNTMSLDITAMAIIKVQFGLVGKDNVVGTSTVTADGGHQSQVLAALTTPPVTSSVNVGYMLVDGVPAAAAVKSLKFDSNNNMRAQEIIASSTPGGFGMGSFDLKGTTEVYLEDTTLWDKVLSHEDVSQLTCTKDTKGNKYAFGIPLANFAKGAGKAGGKNQDVMLPLEWEASRDPVTNAMLVISRSATVTNWT